METTQGEMLAQHQRLQFNSDTPNAQAFYTFFNYHFADGLDL